MTENKDFYLDSSECEHPEEHRTYGEKLACLATREQPAEYWEWFTCDLCGETIEL